MDILDPVIRLIVGFVAFVAFLIALDARFGITPADRRWRYGGFVVAAVGAAVAAFG